MYSHNEIQKKWLQRWKMNSTFSPDVNKAKKPYYNLMMFPYPSAEGLHVGNMYAFTGSDIYGRKKRMEGFDVFEPIGLDGFGIHSENYALKVGKHPQEQSKISQINFYRQLEEIGNAYDWKNTLETYDEEYYKWTQWIFIQLFKKGLAYRSKSLVNFCPSDKTVLADEQAIDGKCERCSTVVIKKEIEQWFFRITKYSDRLLKGLDKIDWSEKVKIAQKNWIGRKEGARIKFAVKGSKNKFVEVFTTRVDTLYGATFLVLAPELKIIEELTTTDHKKDIKMYQSVSAGKTLIDRQEAKVKTGIFTGSYALNPLSNDELPIWVADYALTEYGTGALFGDAHDERDFEFAKKFKIPLKPTINTGDKTKDANINALTDVFTGEGTLVKSGEFTGLLSTEAKKKIVEKLKKMNLGKTEVTYHLRDWLISRQRYWGPPIPMIHCEKCGWQPEDEKKLPVLLPEVDDWKPIGTGESPLASVESFVNTKCPNCDGKAQRETDVSDTFLDSSWYFLRYLSSNDSKRIWDPNLIKKWLPVDMYIGGAEHSVLHLLYTRFLTMFFYDNNLTDFEEPFKVFRAHGLLISEGAKMSKSKGNIVNPDDYIEKYGTDTLRCYLMFCGRYKQGGDFQDHGIEGIRRFLNRVWNFLNEAKFDTGKLSSEDQFIMHKTIKQVSDDIDSLDYNTVISALMIWSNYLSNKSSISKVEAENFLKLLAPLAPFVTEELWSQMNPESKSIHTESWPKYDPTQAQLREFKIVVQVNGKVRAILSTKAGVTQEELEKMSQKSERVSKYLNNNKFKVVFVKDRLINFVLK